LRSSPVVLVVDDEWLVRDFIATQLRAARLRTLEAASGEAAVSLLDTVKHVDAVFTDIQLGGTLSGWEVGVRARRILPRVPVIYTSGTALRLEPSLAVPESLFFAKPYRPEVIVQALRRVVSW
jgi:CheY-like chemotaxis protein